MANEQIKECIPVKRPKLDELANELSLIEIKDLLRKKQKEAVRLEKLQVKKKSLLTQIQEIEAEMKKLGGEADAGKLKAAKKPGRKGRQASRGGKTVSECALEYLNSVGKKARLGDIVSYVVKQRKGQTEPTLGDLAHVITILGKEKSVKRVGRGLYCLVAEKAPESEAGKKDAKKTVKRTGKEIPKPSTATEPR